MWSNLRQVNGAACALLALGVAGVVLWGLGGETPSWADVPRTIQYQAKLTELDGSPLVGQHTVTLRLYEAPTGGTALWEEQHTITLVPGDNGTFSVTLGSASPFGPSVNFNQPLWLSFEVDGDGEFSPRQPLTAVGYAINAATLGGLQASQLLANLNASNLTSGEVPNVRLSSAVSLLGQLIDSPELADGAIVAADTADTFLTAGGGVAITKSPSSWTIAASGSGDGTITGVTAGAGLTGGGASGNVTLDVGAGTGVVLSADSLSIDAGTAANQIVQLDGSGALPAVSGANLTNLSVGPTELEDGAVTSTKLAVNSVGANALAAGAIQPGDIEVGDLPAHAGTHQPGGSDALPTAAAISVGSSNSAGTSTSLARADHGHQGVHSMAASGQPQLSGDVTLAAGDRITLTQAGQTITIEAEEGDGGGAGARVTAFASNSTAISSSSDTMLLSASIAKSQGSSALLVLASVQLNHSSGGNKTVDLKLFRGSTQLDATYRARIGSGGGQIQELSTTLHAWDTSGAGTHTFSLRARASDSGATATVRRLTIIELL